MRPVLLASHLKESFGIMSSVGNMLSEGPLTLLKPPIPFPSAGGCPGLAAPLQVLTWLQLLFQNGSGDQPWLPTVEEVRLHRALGAGQRPEGAP